MKVAPRRGSGGHSTAKASKTQSKAKAAAKAAPAKPATKAAPAKAPKAAPKRKKAAPTTPAAGPLAIAPAAVTNLPATYAGIAVQPPKYDPTTGKAAFDGLATRLSAIPADQVIAARADVQGMALVALGVYGFVEQATAVQKQFEALDAAGLFSTSTLQDLEQVALAALYAFTQAEAAGAFATSATVPAALVTQAKQVEARMQKRCEYALETDPEVAPILDMLRPGTGHADLANDLLGYADIYETHHAQIAVAGDPNYVATDMADARSLAGQIMAYMTSAMTPKASQAYDQMQRAWTLLKATYAEVQEAGLWLLRFDPKRHQRFPSLLTAVRAPKAKKAAAPAAGAAAAPAPATTAAKAAPVASAATPGGA